jgi:hypothetical protein
MQPLLAVLIALLAALVIAHEQRERQQVIDQVRRALHDWPEPPRFAAASSRDEAFGPLLAWLQTPDSATRLFARLSELAPEGVAFSAYRHDRHGPRLDGIASSPQGLRQLELRLAPSRIIRRETSAVRVAERTTSAFSLWLDPPLVPAHAPVPQ